LHPSLLVLSGNVGVPREVFDVHQPITGLSKGGRGA
jgi:hypothetical protein